MAYCSTDSRRSRVMVWMACSDSLNFEVSVNGLHYLLKSNWAPVHHVFSVVVTALESRRTTSCRYNSNRHVWHTLYECVPDMHGDSSPFLLQPFHESSNGFWPRLTSPRPAIQFVPMMFYRVEVGALGGPVQSANIVVGCSDASDPGSILGRLLQFGATKQEQQNNLVSTTKHFIAPIQNLFLGATLHQRHAKRPESVLRELGKAPEVDRGLGQVSVGYTRRRRISGLNHLLSMEGRSHARDERHAKRQSRGLHLPRGGGGGSDRQTPYKGCAKYYTVSDGVIVPSTAPLGGEIRRRLGANVLQPSSYCCNVFWILRLVWMYRLVAAVRWAFANSPTHTAVIPAKPLQCSPYASQLPVHDKVSTFEINRNEKSLALPAYILTGALSDMRPVKLATKQSVSKKYTMPLPDGYILAYKQVADSAGIGQHDLPTLCRPVVFAGLKTGKMCSLSCVLASTVAWTREHHPEAPGLHFLKVRPHANVLAGLAFHAEGLANRIVEWRGRTEEITEQRRDERAWGNGRSPRRRSRQAASSDTMPTCVNPGVTSPGEPCAQWRWRTHLMREAVSSLRLPRFSASIAEKKGSSLLASHLGEPGSIPGRVTPGFSHVEIVPDDAAGRRVFSGISHLPRPFIPTLLHTLITFIASQDLARTRKEIGFARQKVRRNTVRQSAPAVNLFARARPMENVPHRAAANHTQCSSPNPCATPE
ncbi:hypothetical protein PR048_024868 [Dryococelus australis]|uniref:Uncharacterized protein n=1 Tax=Dryococelus australis TaxID=614101 RepID=A0ABQ9GPV6_9NEOP|nr:hypothetical protein PR048_024868 [Dryococelus australis]